MYFEEKAVQSTNLLHVFMKSPKALVLASLKQLNGECIRQTISLKLVRLEREKIVKTEADILAVIKGLQNKINYELSTHSDLLK